MSHVITLSPRDVVTPDNGCSIIRCVVRGWVTGLVTVPTAPRVHGEEVERFRDSLLPCDGDPRPERRLNIVSPPEIDPLVCRYHPRLEVWLRKQ